MDKAKLLKTSLLICGAVFAFSTHASADTVACNCGASTTSFGTGAGQSCLASSNSAGLAACVTLCKTAKTTNNSTLGQGWEGEASTVKCPIVGGVA